jgi:CBS domain-containing protein
MQRFACMQPVRAIDVMSPAVYRFGPDSRASGAWAFMRAHEVRHLCVVDDQGRLMGIVSDRDILLLGEERYASPTALREVMTAEPITRSGATPAAELAELMLSLHIDAVPIVDAQRRPIGIVTSTDLLSVLAHAA